MGEQILAILRAARDWLTASEIANTGGWRSATSVGVSLRHLETAGEVVRRTSQTARQINGQPASEWRIASKAEADPEEAKAREQALSPIQEAFGQLHLVLSRDARIHRARVALSRALTADERKAAIEQAERNARVLIRRTETA